MTPRALAYEALAYINASGTPGAPGVVTITAATAAQKARIASDLTAVMQELYEQAPALYRRTLGATLAAPATITVTATDGSTTVTTASSFTEGATIFIGGINNQIFTENGVKRLLLPFSGTTGAQSATLYGDLVALDSSVAEVLDEVFIADGPRLTRANNRADFLSGRWREAPDYGRARRFLTSKPLTGRPLSYWVEDFMLTDGSHTSTRRLRVMPMPLIVTNITYDVRLSAPVYSVADLGTDSVDSTKTIPVASNYVESLVRPLFLKRWSASPWWRSTEVKKDIDEDAARARARLLDFHSQQRRTRRMVAPI